MRISDWSSDVCSSDLQALGEEQSLVDDRAARQATDIEVGDLRRDHLFFDEPADQIKWRFELGGRGLVRTRPGDHEMLQLGTRALRLAHNHRHVTRPPDPAPDRAAALAQQPLGSGQDWTRLEEPG